MKYGCQHVAGQFCDIVNYEFMIAVTRANHCFIMLLLFRRLGLRFYLRLHDRKYLLTYFSEAAVLHCLGANVQIATGCKLHPGLVPFASTWHMFDIV